MYIVNFFSFCGTCHTLLLHCTCSLFLHSIDQALKNSGGKSDEYYDKVYFDSSGSSDEGEMEDGGSGESSSIRNVGRKVRKLTNDELFYDPEMDAEDEKWVNRQRMAYHNGRLSYM